MKYPKTYDLSFAQYGIQIDVGAMALSPNMEH